MRIFVFFFVLFFTFPLDTSSLCTANSSSCLPGQYRNSSSNCCVGCTAGYSCAGNASLPVLCPLCSICPANSSSPVRCANGSCTLQTGSSTASQCLCPPQSVSGSCACLSGYYNLSNSSSPWGWQCTACGPAAWCANSVRNACPAFSTTVSNVSSSSAACNCSAGYYGNWSLGCLPCNASFYCQGGAVAPVACPGNSSSTAVSVSLSSCVCNIGWGLISGNRCAVCLTGSYTSPAGLCTPCVANSYCPGSGSSIACAIGLVSPANSTKATACVCPLGTYSSACTPCPLGWYANTTNSSACRQCAANSGTLSLGSSSCVCNPGFYGSGCAVCKAGSWCVSGLMSQCAPNTTSLAGASVCCANSTVLVSSTCTPCGYASYARGGMCTPCMAFSNTSTPAASSASQCVCVPGYYYSASVGGCLQCTANSYCVAGYMTACPSNTYALPGSSACGCPTNAEVLIAVGCVCRLGYYAIQQSYALASWGCSPCLAGQYCVGGVSVQCPSSSYYCPAVASVPLLCPAGNMCVQSVLTPCDAGFFCAAGSSAQSPCTAGFYCPAASASPTLCPAGSWCAQSASAPVTCGAGNYSTSVGQSSPSVCAPCTVCGVGSYEITPCLAYQNRVCQACSNKPSHAVYLGTGSSCPWVCDNAYGGSTCSPCPTGFWCRYGVQNRCPLNSVSPTLSSSQDSCTCLPGYVSDTASVSGTSPCVKCQSGRICAGTAVVSSAVSVVPLANVTTQLILVQKTLPPANSLVTLFVNVPSSLASVRSLLPNTNASIYTRQVCRGSYCANCDGSALCVKHVAVLVVQQTVNVSLPLQFDTLYAVSAVGCVSDGNILFPGLGAEYYVGNLLALSSISGVSNVAIRCSSNASVAVNVSVDTAAATSRRLLSLSPSRRLLQTGTGDALLVSVVVAAGNETNATQAALQASNSTTVQGYSSVAPLVVQAPVSCPANSTSPEGSVSLSQCTCLPGYEGNASQGADCTLCPVDAFCASVILGLCQDHAYAPPGSQRSTDCLCVAGFYGNESCTQCPASRFCTGGASVQNCTANAVSSPQSTSATSCFCDRGYYGVNNNPCTLCEAGYWCWTGVRNQCPLNSDSYPGASRVTNCTCVGGYQDITTVDNTGGVTKACVLCGADTYCQVITTREYICTPRLHPQHNAFVVFFHVLSRRSILLRIIMVPPWAGRFSFQLHSMRDMRC